MGQQHHKREQNCHSSWQWRLVDLEFKKQLRSYPVSQFTWPTFPLQALSSKLFNQYLCAFFGQKLTTALLESAEGRKWLRKYFMINLHERILPDLAGIKPATICLGTACWMPKHFPEFNRINSWKLKKIRDVTQNKCIIALKMPRKLASEYVVCLCCPLHLLANFSNILFAYT